MASERFTVGEYIRDELDARGWTTADCAARMGGEANIDELTLDLHLAAIDAPEDHAIRRGKMGVSTACGLERALGIPAKTWLVLDRRYHENRDKTDASV